MDCAARRQSPCRAPLGAEREAVQQPQKSAAEVAALVGGQGDAQAMLAAMGRTPVSRTVKTETSAVSYVMSDPAVILDENDKWQQLWDKLFLSK